MVVCAGFPYYCLEWRFSLLFCSVCCFAQFVGLLSLLFCSSFGFYFSNKHLWTDVRQRICVRRISLHIGMEAQHRMMLEWEGKWLKLIIYLWMPLNSHGIHDLTPIDSWLGHDDIYRRQKKRKLAPHLSNIRYWDRAGLAKGVSSCPPLLLVLRIIIEYKWWQSF